MARPAMVQRVVISGHLPGGETFAWGFWLNGYVGSQTLAQTEATTIASYFDQYLGQQAQAMISADSGYDTVDVYSYTAAGPAPADYHASAVIPTGTGTSVAASLPLQVAWVVTLNTDIPTRRTRGRFYMPVNAYALTAHQMTQAQIDANLAAVDSFFSNINSSADIFGDVTVVSPTGGLSTEVTSVSADSRLDVQRRRAESEIELYQASLVI